VGLHAVAGSLSVASTAVSSVKVGVVDYGELSRSAVYITGIILALGRCLVVRSH
jgi:hypothetical protein